MSGFLTHADYEKYSNLFEFAIFAAPETELSTHTQWFDRTRIFSKTYVTFNRKDFVLKQAYIHVGEIRLGSGVIDENGSMMAISDRAIYVDTLPVASGHRYIFDSENPHIKSLITSINENTFPADHLIKIKGNNLLKMRNLPSSQ